jgi:DNA ligase-1
MGLTLSNSKYTVDIESEHFQGIAVAEEWIRDLESSDSRLHKERVIEKALMASKLGSYNAQCFLFNCYLAYNPYYTYHVKKVPESQALSDRPNDWTKFWALCEALRTRSVTGFAAKHAIDKVMQDFDSEEWNMVCRRVLIKDLRCGISEKTLNKVLGKTEWRIPVFTCQLAQDSEGSPHKLKGRKRLECKLDGVRVLASVNMNGSVVLYSRNGKVFNNFVDIENAIIEKFDSIREIIGKYNMVLDGEIVGESFQSLMKQAHRKSDANTTGMTYHIFDFIPLDRFEHGVWNVPLYERIQKLDKLTDQFQDTDCLRIMPGLEVDLDSSEGHDIMRRFAEHAVQTGFEGIMIKDAEAHYKCNRNSGWMKWKPTITLDLNIVGFEEGTGRNQGRLGAIICEGVDNERRISVSVGSGFTDSDRDSFYARRMDLLGHVVEIEADAVTQNQDGSYSLRFPRFVRFRGFEAGEKL